jgi:hypothetical protein
MLFGVSILALGVSMGLIGLLVVIILVIVILRLL